MLKILIGAATLATFVITFMASLAVFGRTRLTLFITFATTLGAGYLLFSLADRYDLVHEKPKSRGLLDGDDR